MSDEQNSELVRSKGQKPKPSLRNILYDRVRAAHDRAVNSGGDISAEEVESLSRLTRIAEIWDKVAAQQPRNRLLIAGIFLLTLLFTSILLFWHVHTTDIEFSVITDEVQFVLSAPREVTVRSALAELGVAGQTETEIPGGGAKSESSDFDFPGDTLLSAGNGGKPNMPAMILPSSTRIQIIKSPIPRQYRLSLGGTQFDLQADVLGTVRVVSGGQQFSRVFGSPRAVRFKVGSEVTSLTITFLDSPIQFFRGGLPVKDLNLLSVEYLRGPDGPPARIFSPLLRGSIFFEELNGAERTLRRGEWVRFETSGGELRSVLFEDEHIVLQFHGIVSGLSIGADDHARSAMPTILEWLRVQRSATLLWGSALYLFTLAMAVLKWYRALS